MIEKVSGFPIERLYFLESKEFLDKKERIYLKSDDTFKLNSYCLGVSKQRFNNDKILYLFNGLRGYYDVKTKYMKKPTIMEINPPLSKAVYNYDYLLKKYRFSDLLIYSLKKFNRPTISLNKDIGENLYYNFPYKLVDYLNQQRNLIIGKNTYKHWKVNYSTDLRHVIYRLKLNPNRKYKGFGYAKILPSFILGYYDGLLNMYIKYQNSKIIKYNRLQKLFFNKTRRSKTPFYKRAYKLRKFYKAARILRLFVFAANKILRKTKRGNYFNIRKVIKQRKRIIPHAKILQLKLRFGSENRKIFGLVKKGELANINVGHHKMNLFRLKTGSVVFVKQKNDQLYKNMINYIKARKKKFKGKIRSMAKPFNLSKRFKRLKKKHFSKYNNKFNKYNKKFNKYDSNINNHKYYNNNNNKFKGYKYSKKNKFKYNSNINNHKYYNNNKFNSNVNNNYNNNNIDKNNNFNNNFNNKKSNKGFFKR